MNISAPVVELLRRRFFINVNFYSEIRFKILDSNFFLLLGKSNFTSSQHYALASKYILPAPSPVYQPIFVIFTYLEIVVNVLSLYKTPNKNMSVCLSVCRENDWTLIGRIIGNDDVFNSV